MIPDKIYAAVLKKMISMLEERETLERLGVYPKDDKIRC